MDKETASYIKNYFTWLMTEDERLALNYHIYTYKTEDNPQMRKELMERGWISASSVTKALLEEGYEAFELNVAGRIMKETPTKVLLNNCPKCNKLARTPFAKQCRHCGYGWHHLTVAQFKLDSIFQLTGRPFFLLGVITKGEVKQGQFIDLTVLGLNKRPKIESIEYTFQRQDEIAWEGIGLGTNDLNEEDKAYLKMSGALGKVVDIIWKE